MTKVKKNQIKSTGRKKSLNIIYKLWLRLLLPDSYQLYTYRCQKGFVIEKANYVLLANQKLLI